MILVFAKIKFRDINFRVDQFFSGFSFFRKTAKTFLRDVCHFHLSAQNFYQIFLLAWFQTFKQNNSVFLNLHC